METGVSCLESRFPWYSARAFELDLNEKVTRIFLFWPSAVLTPRLSVLIMILRYSGSWSPLAAEPFLICLIDTSTLISVSMFGLTVRPDRTDGRNSPDIAAFGGQVALDS